MIALTVSALERAGTDAGALFDAHRREIEQAAECTPDKAIRCALADDLKDLDTLHAEYFGGEA